MTDAAENAVKLPHLRREDFTVNLVTARGRGASYTVESVDALVDNFVGNGNALVDRVNELSDKPATTLVGADEADRLTEQARDLFEETSRTAAAHIAAAQQRAAKIGAEADASAKKTTDAAHAEADRVTSEATAWADDLRDRTNAEIQAALDAARAELERLHGVRTAAEARIAYVTGRLAEFHRQQVEDIEALGASVHQEVPQEEAAPAAAVEPEALELEDADVEVPVDEPVAAADETAELTEKPARRSR